MIKNSNVPSNSTNSLIVSKSYTNQINHQTWWLFIWFCTDSDEDKKSLLLWKQESRICIDLDLKKTLSEHAPADSKKKLMSHRKNLNLENVQNRFNNTRGKRCTSE